MKSILKLSLFGIAFITALSSGMSQAQQTSSSESSIELVSAHGAPDTRVFAFLRQERDEHGNLTESPVRPYGSAGSTVMISIYSQTATGKTGAQSFIFQKSRSQSEEIGVTPTCLCFESPVVTEKAYEFDNDSLALMDPLIELYVISQGQKYGPYAVRPEEVKALTPISGFGLQNELKHK